MTGAHRLPAFTCTTRAGARPRRRLRCWWKRCVIAAEALRSGAGGCFKHDCHPGHALRSPVDGVFARVLGDRREGEYPLLGDGWDGFRPYGGSLWKSPKVTKGLLPHHSAPRLGSVCPHSGTTERAAATGRPCPVAAKPASCRFTRSVLPAFGQRGLTGRLRSRSKADQEHSGLPAGLSGVEQNQKQTRSTTVGASLLAKVVNDDVGILNERGV